MCSLLKLAICEVGDRRGQVVLSLLHAYSTQEHEPDYFPGKHSGRSICSPFSVVLCRPSTQPSPSVINTHSPSHPQAATAVQV